MHRPVLLVALLSGIGVALTGCGDAIGPQAALSFAEEPPRAAAADSNTAGPAEPMPTAEDAGPGDARDAGEVDPDEALRNWPQWRGPLGTGAAPLADPPIEWSAEKNVRWKVELPGLGHSTPIVWGDRVFVTAAVPFGDALPPKYSGRPGEHDNLPTTHRHEFVVIALDRETGRVVWQRTVARDLPRETGHRTASLASNSPVTDGRRVYAFFGSRGLYCLDFAGKPVWTKDLGEMHTLHGHGEGASPVLHGEALVVNWDHEGQSFVVAFDKRTGNERWKVERDEPTSWATPIVVEVEGKPQVVVSGTNRIRGYDLATGAVVWECGGLSTNVVSSPVAAEGMVYAGSSYDTRAMLGIRIEGARGDLTGTERVIWSRIRGTPYVPSPLLYGDALYFLNHYQNVLTRVQARTGHELPGPIRLNGIGDLYASPVAAAGRVYATDLDGRTIVLTHADEPKVLAVNELGEPTSASAALAGGDLFLRGDRHLYRIAEEK
ncbi:MAG: PQQ-binding-like beta-propeller repeat protein [Planctomycetales bacterium]